MMVNGLQLPESFVRLCRAIREGKLPETWHSRTDTDAFRNSWDCPDLEIYPSQKRINANTAYLSWAFHQEDRFHQYPEDYADRPGYIDLDDISKIVWFGTTPSGEPFCFDYQDSQKEPSVIYWTDAYWRRVAPTFELFIELFRPSKPSEATVMSPEEMERLLEVMRRYRPCDDLQPDLPGINWDQDTTGDT